MAEAFSFEEAQTPVAAKQTGSFSFEEAKGIASKPVEEKSSSSARGAFSRSAARSVLPTAAGLAAFMPGAELGALATPFFPPLGFLAGGTITSMLASGGAGWGQEELIKTLPEETQKSLGVDKEQQQADTSQHPIASIAGSIAPMAVAMRPGFISKTQTLLGAGLAGGISVGEQLTSNKPFSWTEAVTQTAVGAVLQKPTRLGLALGIPAHIETPTKTPLKQEETPAKPEDFEALLQKWQVENAKQAATPSPEAQKAAVGPRELVETALKDNVTGEVKPTGPKHPEDLKAETIGKTEISKKKLVFIDEETAFASLKDKNTAIETSRKNHVIDRETKDLQQERENLIEISRPPMFEGSSKKSRPRTLEEDLRLAEIGDELSLAQLKHKPRETLLSFKEDLQEELSNLSTMDSDKYTEQRIPKIQALLKDLKDFETRATQRVEGLEVPKEGTSLKYQPGFLTKEGKFLDRKEAARRAVETGQIPKDHTFDFPNQGLHSGDLRRAGDVKFDTPIEGPLAKTSKDGIITLNHAAIEQDFREGFKYIFDPSTPTGAQKAEVFKSLGITKEDFAKIITTPEEYKTFLKAHEQSHIDNGDRAAYPRDAEGKIDLMHPSAIDIEARATSDALAAVKEAKPPVKEVPLPESVTTTEDFHTKGQQVLKDHGPEAAKKFAEDVAKYQKDHNAPVPTNEKEAASSFHELGTKDSADANEFMKLHQDMEKEGVTSEIREKFYSEWEKKGKGNLTPEEQVLFDKHFKPLVDKHKALYERNVALGRAPSEDMHPDFASRVRLWDPNKTAIQTLWERLTRQEGAFAEKVGGDPTSLEKRNLFVLEHPNGRRTVVQQVGNKIYRWSKGERKLLADYTPDLKKAVDVGLGEFSGTTLKEATVDELHQHTPYRYSKDAVAVVLGKLAELRKFDRAANFLDSWKQSPMWGEVATQDANVAKAQGWQTPKYIDKVPQLAGYFFEPKTKYVIEDFAKSWDNSLYMKLTSALIKNMMLNPLPHIMNEVMHLFVARGASSWVNPKAYARFAETGWKAMQDVWNQSPLYIEIMREGGSMMSDDMRANAFHDALNDKAAREAFPEISNIAKKAGLKPVELYQGMLKASNKTMWMTRDAMYIQMIRELKVRNPKMTTREAIAKVEQHMPNYQIPTTVAGSRKLSEVLQNPNVSVFSKYHYGLVNSMMSVVKEMNPKNLSTPEGRVEFRQGLDSALAYAVGMAILYPIADEIAKKMFGDESMEQRRAGPFHIIEAVKNVSQGKADTQAILSPLFTFNPMLLTTGQLIFNRKLYSGRHVYESDDKAGMIAKDVGKYLAHSVPQAGAIMDTSKQDTTTDATKAWVAKQMDIKSKAPAAQRTEKRAKTILERKRQQRLREWNRP